MPLHPDVQAMAATAFAEHRMTRGPGLSWRLAKPGTGIYGFRVTWTPGSILVSGDVGNATYTVWPSFATLWGAVELIAEANHDYLAGKSTASREYDREATIRHLLAAADERQRHGDHEGWEQIVEAFVPEASYRRTDPVTGRRRTEWLLNPRNGALQMRAASALRDSDLEPHDVYQATGDAEAIVYDWPASTRWHYEAVRLWARTMLAKEPAWHRLWRRWREHRQRLRRDLRDGLLWRPAICVAANGGTFNGSRTWVRHARPGGKVSYRAVSPFRPFGLDLSGAGLWCFQGGNWPVSKPEDETHFAPAEAAHA